MKKQKKIISSVIAVIIVLTFSMTAFAAPPVPGSTLYVDTKTDAYNSADGRKYKRDTGSPYEFLKVKEYDGNPCYCIEKGARFTRTLYKSQSLSGSAYWRTLPVTVQNGIALTAAFGYPALSPSQLGVPTADDAYVATQAIIWEYLDGYRTTPNNLTNSGHKKTVDGTPAAAAYSNILSKISAYVTNPQYKGDIQKTAGFVSLTSGSASEEQELICFYGTVPGHKDRGIIEIIKKDNFGNLLNGAEFSVYDEAGNIKYKKTVSNGKITILDVPFGTYTIVESKYPNGFKSDGTKSYRAVLNEYSPNLTVTVNAVNIDKKAYK